VLSELTEFDENLRLRDSTPIDSDDDDNILNESKLKRRPKGTNTDLPEYIKQGPTLIGHHIGLIGSNDSSMNLGSKQADVRDKAIIVIAPEKNQLGKKETAEERLERAPTQGALATQSKLRSQASFNFDRDKNVS
jgi:hypothetical protein